MADPENLDIDDDEAVADEAMINDDLLQEGREALDRAKAECEHNYTRGADDLRFARKGEQWPADILQERIDEGKPCLVINKLPAFIRQVVNDARQNKPSIQVHPVDSAADPETADVINGLIRNIEQVSSADVAYDTGIECGVSNGFGYIRVGIDHAFDDSFDMDIDIRRVANPFSVFGDPNTTSVDGSDWDEAFVLDKMSKKAFKRKYKGKANVSFDDDAWLNCGVDWLDDDQVVVCEWWTREEVEKTIVKLSNGMVVEEAELTTDEELSVLIEQGALSVAMDADGEAVKRVTKSYKVTQRIMSGVEILETNDWPGKYIPIVPIYGDDFNIEGERYFLSLVHPAKDAQREHNYWRSAATETVALAPRVPYIGPVGAFDADPNWDTANTKNHAYLEYEGAQAPMRQPLDGGVAAGALQQAMLASDDMKAIIGLYDASMGARSNETSGRAIMARQREGDVATFHFIDNMSRSIRQVGRIVVDLIPKVYTGARIVRVIGEDGQEENKPINQQFPKQDPKTGQPMMQPQIDQRTGQPMQGPDGQPMMEAIMGIYDLSAGKYDLTVSSGPSFTSRREEAAMQMTEMVRAFPAIAPIVLDILAKNMDWPEADKIAERLATMVPQQAQGGLPPEVQQQMQKMGEDAKNMQKMIQKLQQIIEGMKADQTVKQQANAIDAQEAQTKQFEAETNRMAVETDRLATAAKAATDRITAAQAMQQPPAPAYPQF